MGFKFNPLTGKLDIGGTAVNFTGVINYKGAYAAGTDYAVGDSVDYQGTSYVMFNDAAAGTVPTNTTYWQVLAEKGEVGDTGAAGPNNITTSTATNLTGFLKGNGSVVSADNSTYLTTESDPVFTASDAASITATDITNLGNLSGTNTGDQDATDFDIKDLTDLTSLRTTWSGKQDALTEGVDYLNKTNLDLTYAPISITQYTDEMAQDAVGGVVGAGLAYDDGTGAISSTITQYTDALARAAISETVTGLTYTSATGVLSLTTGYVIPTTTQESAWHAAVTLNANHGLSLSGQELAMGTPSTLTAATTNAVTTTTHTHAITGFLTSVTPHDLLSATHGDTTASAVARGDLIVGTGATPKWDNLAIGTAGKALVSDGTDVGWSSSALGTAAYTATTAYEPAVTWGDGLEITGSTAAVDFNTTNLKITSTELDTIQGISTAASPEFTDLTLSGGDLVMSSAINVLHTDTSNGADTKYLYLAGGGLYGQTRGAGIQMVGNEAAVVPGQLTLVAGNVGTAGILFYTGGVNSMTLSSTGNLTALNITDSGLTSGRITYASTAGLLVDSANMTYDGTTETLTATSAGAQTNLINLVNSSSNAGTATGILLQPSTASNRKASIVAVQSGADGANWIDLVFSTASASDAIERMRLDRAGKLQLYTGISGIEWGDNAGTYDVNLKRGGANLLETEDTFKAAGYQSSDGSAGATGTITLASITTITVKNGLITAYS